MNNGVRTAMLFIGIPDTVENQFSFLISTVTSLPLENNVQWIDRVFSEFLKSGFYELSVTDPAILAVLRIAERERNEGVPWYRRTHRFLPLVKHGDPLTFVFTTDKSDLSTNVQRILEIGEEAALFEQGAKKLAEETARRERAVARTELFASHADQIKAFALAVIRGEEVSVEAAQVLDDVGLLQPTTERRCLHRFPGECQLLLYDFEEDSVRYMGYIGFGADMCIISLDQRYPEGIDPQYFGQPLAA